MTSLPPHFSSIKSNGGRFIFSPYVESSSFRNVPCSFPDRETQEERRFQALPAVVLVHDTPLSGLLLCAAGQGLKQHYNKKCFYVCSASTRSFSCWVKPARMCLHRKKEPRDNRVRPCPKMLSGELILVDAMRPNDTTCKLHFLRRKQGNSHRWITALD